MTVNDEIRELGPWFHNLHLPGGVQTAPDHPIGDFPSDLWTVLRPLLEDDLSGWSALDIGCNAGFYSVHLAQLGAQVTAIDVDSRYLRQAEWAARQFGVADRVQFRQQSVYDLARTAERFDLVLFMGVFYHLRHPLLALDIVASTVQRQLIFQSLSMPQHAELEVEHDYTLQQRDVLAHAGWPHMAFVEHRFAHDPTNWWVPNNAAIHAMLRSSGLRVVERRGEALYDCRPDPAQDAWLRNAREAERLAATGA